MKPVSLGTALWLSVGRMFAQTEPAPQPLTFEVASVKPSPQNCPGGACPSMISFEPGGGLRVAGVPLKRLIGIAYQVQDFQITGGPAWINTDRFDINAKAESHNEADAFPADPSKLTDEQRKTGADRMRERLRDLLADRFQLVIRRESKEQQVYALVVAKGGPKLQGSKEGKGMMRLGRGMLSGEGVEPAFLATALSGRLGRPVIDKTGLTGKYDFELKWTPDPGQFGPPGPPPPGVQLPPPPDPNGPSLFTALPEQLGLRLQSEKAPAEVLVIERVDKPSEN
jgi:bla regulator protein blaR1